MARATRKNPSPVCREGRVRSVSVHLNHAVFDALSKNNPCICCGTQPEIETRIHRGVPHYRLICPQCKRTTPAWHPIQTVAEIGWNMINAPEEEQM